MGGAFACFVSEEGGDEARLNSSDALLVGFGLSSLGTILERTIFLDGGRSGGVLAFEFDLDNDFFVSMED